MLPFGNTIFKTVRCKNHGVSGKLKSQNQKGDFPMTKIYCYPRCTTCQKATKFLDAKSVEYEYINIKENNPDKETLRSLWQKSGLELKKFFNTSGILYREMELSKKLGTMSDEEKLDLLATDGMLVKRPILITENTVLVGFKESDWEREV